MKTTKPNNINGNKLEQELNAAGITISGLTYENGVLIDDSRFLVDADNSLRFNIIEGDEEIAKAIVAIHNGTI